ncbi:uncharacterized protein LOC125254015 isoform X2 [Megalobrama amblycephala]|uniref:uncharacterized protein LOC125254015 isoform X2 n=1 Tax=Megalobrama amblycephala TaxID=75352 RepID=UPI002013ED8F|nr:uncharacterized protein LOC125254015 isoform X2 [Megalobrama amblycephala]
MNSMLELSASAFPSSSGSRWECPNSVFQQLCHQSLLSFSSDSGRSDISMRNHSFLVLVFLHVVDGVKSVSVMEGDSVTILTSLTEIQTGKKLQWMIQNNTIAEIDRETNKTSVPGNLRFQGRLKLNEMTGSLTITNIKTTDSGVYQLKIRGKKGTIRGKFSVSVRGVFRVVYGVKSVLVMQGDSVTLHTDLTVKKTDDQILWRFGGDIIPRLNSADYKWSNINLISQTGDLNIRYIQNDQAGVYEVEISTGRVILHRKFRITLNGVFSDDGVKKRSAMKGKSVTLQTRITYKPEDDVIEWTFGPQDTALAKTDIKNKILIYNKDDVRFKDRLQLNPISGDLTVKNINTEVSGVYKVKIIKRTYTLQKIFSVTLNYPRPFSGSKVKKIVSGICGSIALVCAAAVFYWKKYRQSRQICN